MSPAQKTIITELLGTLQRIEELKPADDGEAAMAKQLHYYYKRIAVFVARQLRAAGWLHPKYDKLPALKVIRGPWKAQVVKDYSRCWGPIVWDSRKGNYGNTWGADRFQFLTIEQARGVRNILNLVHKQGLDCIKSDS